MKRFLLFGLGVLLIGVGILGLVVPVLPGWLFLFIGFSMTAPRLAARIRWRIFQKRFRRDILYFEEWKPQSVEAGYTTRHFSLHLRKTDDLLTERNQNEFLRLFASSRAVIEKALRPPQKLVLLKQVHGDRIVVLDDPAAFEKPGFYSEDSADGAITRVSCLTLLVFSADCLSIFYSADDWVGLAHAGWRGTKAGLAGKMLKLLSEKSGVPCDRIQVIYGPRIGPSAYRVGEEFTGHFPKTSLRRVRGKLYFDLSTENKRQLQEAGVNLENLTDPGVCTVSQNSDFYSFRKEGEKAGRIVSFITKV